MRITLHRSFLYVLPVAVLLLACSGCTQGDRQKKKSIDAFECEMKRVANRLGSAVSTPLASGKTEGLTPLIEMAKSDLARTGLPLRATVGVLDRNGVVVGGDRDAAPHATENHSEHKTVVYVMKEGQPAAGRIYEQNGAHSYIFCIPVRSNRSTVGVLVLAFQDDDLRKQFGVSGEEIVPVDYDW